MFMSCKRQKVIEEWIKKRKKQYFNKVFSHASVKSGGDTLWTRLYNTLKSATEKFVI